MAVKQAAEWSDKVEQILKLFPMHIRKVMEQAEVFQRLSQKLEEIRVRVNQPLELVTADGAYFLNNGALVRQTDRQCLSVSEEDLRQMSTLMSRYSLYAYEEEIRQGFLTVEGGHRIGVCGQVMQLNGRINRIYPILYLNIRIARERKACGALLYKQLWREQEPENTLLLSAPGNGKTTLRRDLIRLFPMETKRIREKESGWWMNGQRLPVAFMEFRKMIWASGQMCWMGARKWKG